MWQISEYSTADGDLFVTLTHIAFWIQNLENAFADAMKNNTGMTKFVWWNLVLKNCEQTLLKNWKTFYHMILRSVIDREKLKHLLR